MRELPILHEGIREIKILDEEIYKNNNIRVYEHHRWIIDNIPEDFICIAESKDGPEGIQHKTRPIYGLQFHPENFVDSTEGDDFFRAIIKNIQIK